MKIAIISSQLSPNSADLLRFCRDNSIDADVFPLSDISFDTETLDKTIFFSYDVYIFRAYNKNYTYAQSLAHYLLSRGKVVIDAALTKGFIPSKLHEALVYEAYGIPHPRTYFTRSLEVIQNSSITFPIVIKDIDSQRGKGVRLARSLVELEEEITANGKSIILQEFVDMAYDIRVLCIGDKIVGAIRRYVVDGDFRSNVSLGARVEAYELSEAEKTLALRAHSALGYDISGVDIGKTADGELFIIETNITPEWQGFQKATNINVAQHVIEYGKEVYENAAKKKSDNRLS